MEKLLGNPMSKNTMIVKQDLIMKKNKPICFNFSHCLHGKPSLFIILHFDILF